MRVSSDSQGSELDQSIVAGGERILGEHDSFTETLKEERSHMCDSFPIFMPALLPHRHW